MGSVIESRKTPSVSLKLLGRDCHRLVAVRLAKNAGRNQVAHSSATEEIADADKSPPVPGEEHRAAAGLAVVLSQIDLLVRRLVQLALHHTVGPAKVNQVGLLLVAQAEHEGCDRLAQARVRRGVIIGTKSPCPSRVTRVPIACELVRINSGLTLQYPPSCERQPVLAVAGIPGERRASTRPEHQDIGQRIADKIDGGQPHKFGALDSERQRERRERVPSLRAQEGRIASPGLLEGPGSPSRSVRPSRSRSTAWAELQREALIAHVSNVILVCPAIVRSVVLRHAWTGPLEQAATTSARPSASRLVVKRPEKLSAAETPPIGASWNAPSLSLSKATGGPLSAVRTRSRSRSLSTSSRAIPLWARTAQKRLGPRPGYQGDRKPVLTTRPYAVAAGARA